MASKKQPPPAKPKPRAPKPLPGEAPREGRMIDARDDFDRVRLRKEPKR